MPMQDRLVCEFNERGWSRSLPLLQHRHLKSNLDLDLLVDWTSRQAGIHFARDLPTLFFYVKLKLEDGLSNKPAWISKKLRSHALLLDTCSLSLRIVRTS